MTSDRIAVLLTRSAQEQAKLVDDIAVLKAERIIFALHQALWHMVEDAIIWRFPFVPALVTRNLRQISDPKALVALHSVALQATDLAEIEHQIDATLRIGR